ncbi:hypothetical protein [Clostridium botulinum]|uniref:Uncharacterized protein n=1 Tax=Clostridium botulinum TaxID=1491 RepID=A0A9Q1UYF6_CLOBO|nr:hypothetical protein [Clostridium botulinum]KEH99548.1 hypothetical protein Z953_11180 [Clostridium botulinum D str. 16868]KEI04321.1 hypothetical protein Y848_02160 [Clostridium botulinum C/D str. Sp77]KLU75273.1 hypothetical protein CBC3_09785 [Clostridium botulinum V891]KOA76579.1 hypothetical protein ADU77_08930 [Clostridium botulinum]KOA78489.1 hypothetical protein ADU78_01825 [Clostridium botulinum]
MKYYFKKGIQLLFISSIYILFCCYSEINIFISLGFLTLWFYWGYHNSLGFKGGLIVGILGSIFGIVSSLLSLILLLNSPDGSPMWIIVPWSMPLLPLYYIIPNIKLFSILGDYIMYLSVLIVILLTGLGGYFSKSKLNEKIHR